jgi:large subunit ribosomal protein L10
MPQSSLMLRPKEIKAAKIRELEQLFREYSVVGVVGLTRTSAELLHRLRAKMRDVAVFRSVKKTLAIKGALGAGRDYFAEELARIKSPVMLIFTNMNPFLLKLELDGARVLTPPKPNEKADIDVVIPPINTGLQPGPILSEFGKMKIPTRIEGGTIWIARETTVAKAGDAIQPALASLLAKLEIGAVYRSVNLEVAFDGPVRIPKDLLTLNRDEYIKPLTEAHVLVVTLAVRIGYPTPETIGPIIQDAHLRALALSAEAGYVTGENIVHVLTRAARHAEALRGFINSRSI